MTRNQFPLDIIICPFCKKSDLHLLDKNIFCANKDCVKHKNRFESMNNKPVLIDFEESLVEIEAFRDTKGRSIVKRRFGKLSNFIKLIARGKSKIEKRNFLFLQERMQLISDSKILIVGGGQLGSSMEDFYSKLQKNIMSFDIYDSEYVDFVADAHFIPIQDNYFDLVIIGAVLEHVLEPTKVVSEIFRVLKQDGLVYAETPFMQQVHEGPFDFTRYTESGHRFLFKKFKLISSGYIAGVSISLIWALDFFFSGLFRSRYAGKIARLLFFWLRFFDSIIPETFNIDGACGVYFIGTKSDDIIKGKEIINYYKGNQII